MITASTTAPASKTRRGNRRGAAARRVSVIGVALAVIGVAGGCSSSAKSASTPTTSSTVAGQTSTTLAPSTTAAQSKGGGQGSSPATSPPTGPPPVITSFVTPDNIDCHNGNFQMFSASWTTTNAVKTTISIDGPGIYKTYAANAADSLPFNCSTAHSFLLTAYAQNGRTATKTITLQPRNVQSTTTTPTTTPTPTT